MQFNKKQKIAAALGAGAIAVAGSGVAFAYWTTSGTGDGTVGTQGSVANFAVAQTTVAGTPLYPGASQALAGTVKNTDTTAPAQLQLLKVTLKDPTNVGTDPDHPACTAADDYTLVSASGWTVASDGQTATINPNVELGKADSTSPSDTYSFSGLSVQMLDNTDGTAGDGTGNQDNCKGATVNLTYDAS
jgi:hypothetical protein